MKTTTKNTGIKVTTSVKAGGLCAPGPNHNRNGLRVTTGMKAGSLIRYNNHNRTAIAALQARPTGIKVTTSVKAGGICAPGPNHNRNGLRVTTGMKAGSLIRYNNHNRTAIALVALPVKPTTKSTGIKVTTSVKAGGLCAPGPNHSRNGLRVTTGMKAGSLIRYNNHNRTALTLLA